MTWPADVSTTNIDSSSDSPAAWRTDGEDLSLKFNQLKNHVSVLMRAILEMTNAAAIRAALDVPSTASAFPATGGSLSGPLSVGGNLIVGGGANPNTRNVIVNGRGEGAGTYMSIADPSSTTNEVLLGFDAAAGRARIHSSDYPLDEWIGGQLQGTIKSGGVRESRPEGAASLLPLFGVRAWANFNGTGTPAYRARGNFTSSIADHGNGEYSLTFTTPMPDANYVVVPTTSRSGTTAPNVGIVSMTASGFRIRCADPSGVGVDADIVCLVVVR